MTSIAKRAPRLSRRALAARLTPVVNYASQAVERPQDALACLLGARAAITEAINRLSIAFNPDCDTCEP